MHTCTQTYIHTYIHTHTYMYVCIHSLNLRTYTLTHANTKSTHILHIHWVAKKTGLSKPVNTYKQTDN